MIPIILSQAHIGYLEQRLHDFKDLLGVLSTLHNARIELLALVPDTEKGGTYGE